MTSDSLRRHHRHTLPSAPLIDRHQSHWCRHTQRSSIFQSRHNGASPKPAEIGETDAGRRARNREISPRRMLKARCRRSPLSRPRRPGYTNRRGSRDPSTGCAARLAQLVRAIYETAMRAFRRRSAAGAEHANLSAATARLSPTPAAPARRGARRLCPAPHLPRRRGTSSPPPPCCRAGACGGRG